MMFRALVGLNAVTAGLCGWLLLAPVSLPDTLSAHSSRLQQTPALTRFSAKDVAGIVDRPLFRAPPQAPRPAPPLAPQQPPTPPPTQERQLRLVGVIDQNGQPIAFIEVQGSRDLMRVGIGGIVEGWRVEIVRPREVALMKDRLKRVLPIDPQKTP